MWIELTTSRSVGRSGRSKISPICIETSLSIGTTELRPVNLPLIAECRTVGKFWVEKEIHAYYIVARTLLMISPNSVEVKTPLVSPGVAPEIS